MLYPNFDLAGFENRRMALKSLQERKIWIVALLLVGLIMREADRLKEGMEKGDAQKREIRISLSEDGFRIFEVRGGLSYRA
jgi:hypothetical protein